MRPVLELQRRFSFLEHPHIEVATSCLWDMAILAPSKEEAVGNVLRQIARMLEGTGSHAVKAEDVDNSVRKAAMERAKRRAANSMPDSNRLPVAR
jgi:hypothetical protein